MVCHKQLMNHQAKKRVKLEFFHFQEDFLQAPCFKVSDKNIILLPIAMKSPGEKAHE